MRIEKRDIALTAFALALAAGPTGAAAQVALSQSAEVDVNNLGRIALFTRDTTPGVLTRPRPEYAPLGIRLGGFTAFTALEGGAELTDNALARRTNKSDDVILRLRPAALVESNWSNHYLAAFGSVYRRQYLDNENESSTQWAAGLRGRLDVRRSFQVAAGASYEQRREQRTETTTPVGTAEQVPYNVALFNIGAEKTFNRLRLAGRFRVADTSFDNPAAIGGGTIFQKYRSNTEYAGQMRAEYAVSPRASAFIQGTLNRRDFRNGTPSIPERDSRGQEITVGANADLTNLIRGEVQVGYLKQNYDRPYGDVSGLSVRARLQYYVTPLTTLSLDVSRSPLDASVQGTGGFLSSSIGFRADHELLRNLILSAALQHRSDKYGDLTRRDRLNRASLSAIYLVSRRVSLRGEFEHLRQTSRGVFTGPNFTVNRLFLSLVYQL